MVVLIIASPNIKILLSGVKLSSLQGKNQKLTRKLKLRERYIVYTKICFGGWFSLPSGFY